MANDEITTKRKAMIEYVSPQAKIYGKRYASPINNDDITSETELKNGLNHNYKISQNRINS